MGSKPKKKRLPRATSMEERSDDPGWERFYRWVRKIPRGRVTTYAGIAALAGNPRWARHVGFALSALRDTGSAGAVPWQRVLGSRGKSRAAISIRDPIGAGLQRSMLEAEGVEFESRGGVSLERFGWRKAREASILGARPRKRSR